MNCEYYLYYLELLSARLDGALSEPEERELEAHLASCPACRAAGAQLAALRPAFSELEDVPAPEGFTKDVMDRIRGENKIVPLFRRPLFKALAGLAACGLLAVGLYGAVRQPQQDWDQITRSYHQDTLKRVEDVPSGEISRSLPDETMTYYTDAAIDDAPMFSVPISDTEILVVDRMPEGGWELIPPETPVSADGLHVTGELLEQIERMAQEQNITASIISGTEESFLHLIVVLDESE